MLYVQLPEGHPVITKSSEEADEAPAAAAAAPPTELSLEEAIEQAEVVFDDDAIADESSAAATAVCQGGRLLHQMCSYVVYFVYRVTMTNVERLGFVESDSVAVDLEELAEQNCGILILKFKGTST